MSPQPPPPGIYVPVPTFFESDSGALDLKLQCSHATFLAKSGIKGLVLCGSTGEAPHMTKNERSNLFSKVRTHLTENGVGQEFPIIAGVTSENIEDAIADLKAASEHASHGLVLVPSYFASAGKNVHYQEGLVNWFQKVADGSPIPILM